MQTRPAIEIRPDPLPGTRITGVRPRRPQVRVFDGAQRPTCTILLKIDARDRAQAVVLAYRSGLMTERDSTL